MKKKGRTCRGFSFDSFGRKVLDSAIIDKLKHYRKDPMFCVEGGSKALSRYVRRDSAIIVNHKKVYRLCREEGLLLQRSKKKSHQGSVMRSQNRRVSGENKVWEFDIKHGWLYGERRSFFILAFIDVGTRAIKAHYVGRSCKAEDMQRTFKLALESCKGDDLKGLVIRSDNGPQMRSYAFRKFASRCQVEHEFIPPRTPNKNAHIEAFFSILDRHLENTYLLNLAEAYVWVNDFVNFYNNHRIHGKLKMTPAEFSKRRDLHTRPEFVEAI